MAKTIYTQFDEMVNYDNIVKIGIKTNWEDADIADDGSILVVMSDTRPDESADEVLVFKLSGF